MFRIVLLAALAAVGLTAHAQSWPNKPVTFLNPFPAGGGTDTFCTADCGQTVATGR